ncbi:M50 family metallopeptidase [Phytohabitans suffuscus]
MRASLTLAAHPLAGEPLAASVEPPSQVLVVAAGILALLITVIGWPLLTHVIAIAHEGGHATAASVSGGRVVAVRLERSGNGRTDFAAGKGQSTLAFIGSAGYIGPSVFGVLGSFLLVKGQVEAILWASLVLVGILLLNVANPFGWFSSLLTGIVLFLVARYAPDAPQTLFAVTWVWFLLFGGYGDVLGLRKVRRALRAAKKRDEETDAGILGKQTWVPAPIWVALFWLGAVAGLLLGAGIMLGMVV